MTAGVPVLAAGDKVPSTSRRRRHLALSLAVTAVGLAAAGASGYGLLEHGVPAGAGGRGLGNRRIAAALLRHDRRG
jgi:hypothetical protein